MTMAFRCPACSASSLRITLRLELPPDSRWDEIALQMIACDPCGFAGLAVYQESRRGALDSEIVHHDGYRVSAADLARLELEIESCPAPDSASCDCRAHRTLGRCDASGRWDALQTIDRNGSFRVEL